MDQQYIYTFAKWQVKPGQLETVLKLLTQVASKTREERGNLFYKVYQNKAEKNTLMLFEGYLNEVAMQEHRTAKYFYSIVTEQVVPLLESREIIVASQLELNDHPTK